MKIFKFFTTSFFLLVFLFVTGPISAQQSQFSQRWVCLKTDWCINQASNCSGKGVLVHRARLTAKPDAKLLPNSDTYIVECLATATGQVCTTGNTNNDMLIYGKDNTASLKTSENYQFQGMFIADGVTPANNPIKSKVNGDIQPLERQSYSKGNERKFLALNFFDPNGEGGLTGKGGQQQGSFSFETQSNLKDCVSIFWDPFGRVFDSQTLEPIPNASVTLLTKRSDGSFSQLLSDELLGGAIENPYITKENGYYSFVIPDGTYKLSISQANYSFPNVETKLNSGYVKAYTELYPQQTGLEIVQKGSIEHRDIPLDPKSSGFNYPVKLIEYFYNLDKSTNKATLEGLVSHPLTIIRLYTLKYSGTLQTPIRNRLLKTITADRYGKFKAEIDQTTFEPTEVFGDLELQKVDLTNNTTSKNLIIKQFLSLLFSPMQKVNASSSSINIVRFNPILNSLSGYAYDLHRNILPHATVGVYLTYANKPYGETKTDGNGYYEIPSERLPDSPYNIQYSTIIGGLQTINTSKFIAQNKTYLENNKINLNINNANFGKGASGNNLFGSGPTPSSTKSAEKGFTTKSEGINVGSSPQANKFSLTKSFSQSNLLLIIVAILLFLFAGVGGLLGLYLIKKNGHY